MLAKSKLNNFIIKLSLIIAIFFTISCEINRKVYNTEIICPKIRIMVRFAEAKEVTVGIKRAIAEKKKYDTSEQYTVIRMPDNRSFKINDIAPEDAIKCRLNQVLMPAKYNDYKKFYH